MLAKEVLLLWLALSPHDIDTILLNRQLYDRMTLACTYLQ
jgi:hypothetical protein